MRETTSGPGYLGVETERTTSVVRIHLRGELDMLTAPLLVEVLEGVRASGGRHLVVDLTELQFMDRAGLAALLDGGGSDIRRGQVLSVTGCSDNVRRVFEMTGHEDVINGSPVIGLGHEPGPG